MNNNRFGAYFREKRIEKGMTLRNFCERFGFDTAYISRIENGKINPPASEKLAVLAESLGIEKNSKEWVTFFDLAHIARNEFPSDIEEQASNVITMLPAFLRTPDGKKISKEKVEKLIDFLQEDSKEQN